jgi:ferredoxin
VKGTVRVTVDPDKCQGHGRCMMYETTMFECDDLGYASVPGDGTVPEAEHEQVWLASLNCPEHAITVDESR